MKERPILFSAPTVLAVLAGAKTTTRRLIKPQPKFDGHDGWMWRGGSALMRVGYGANYVHTDRESMVRAMLKVSPSHPGDRLYVKEHHEFTDCNKDGVLQCIYRADSAVVDMFDAPYTPKLHRGRSSIYMPRWASRITLEVAGVRVERLQDISEADAMAEGVTPADPVEFDGGHQTVTPANRRSFARLWDSIYGAASWDANPLVWVVEFRKASSS